MRLALLGSPVAHSLSPRIHTTALTVVGIPGSYEARDVDAGGFAAAVEEIRSGSLDGANVTMPHKARARRAVDRCSPAAARAGAVNTLLRVGVAVAGHNTDIPGIRDAWAWNGLDPEGPVVVLGSGGAAAAAVLALEGRPLTIAARRPEAASELLAAVGVDARITDLGAPVTGASVVNATPIGMGGETLPPHLLEGCTGYFEMAYGTGPTPAEQMVASTGRPVSTGTELLIAQARLSFRLWTGRDVDVADLRAVVATAR